MADLKNIIYISNEDFETLVSNGSVTIGGETLTYDPNNVYITPDELATTTSNGLMSSSDKTKLDSVQSGAEVNVQSDWNVSDDSSDAFIKNKPTIPSMTNVAYKNVNNNFSVSQSISGDMIANYVAIQSAGHETTSSYDKHLTLSSTNYVRYRTTAELKSDLGIPDTSNFIQKATSTTPAADKIYSGTTSALSPSQCLANGFYYVSSSTNSLSGADSNPFLQYHTSNNDFRILATAYSDQWVQQVATDFRTTHIYYRVRNNGTWTNWVELVTTAVLGEQVTYNFGEGILVITSI